MRNYNDLNLNYKGGNLSIKQDNLTSLDDCPHHITGWFICNINNLTSLVGGPQKVDGYYDCNDNLLTDLVGCASHIEQTLYFSHNQITSLVGIHKIIKSCKSMSFTPRKIKEGGIGLLLIENLTYISESYTPFEIIQSYLGSGTKGMMECSKELKAKGWAEYAKL